MQEGKSVNFSRTLSTPQYVMSKRKLESDLDRGYEGVSLLN